MVYFTLFSISFLAATLLPLSSEALLLYDITQNNSLLFLWISATAGNTLGSMMNYWLGLKGEAHLERKGYLSAQKMKKYRIFFAKYGGWTLLLSWVPVIGDPLTFVAGVLRYDWRYFTLIVFVSKGIRYGVLIWMVV